LTISDIIILNDNPSIYFYCFFSYEQSPVCGITLMEAEVAIQDPAPVWIGLRRVRCFKFSGIFLKLINYPAASSGVCDLAWPQHRISRYPD